MFWMSSTSQFLNEQYGPNVKPWWQKPASSFAENASESGMKDIAQKTYTLRCWLEVIRRRQTKYGWKTICDRCVSPLFPSHSGFTDTFAPLSPPSLSSSAHETFLSARWTDMTFRQRCTLVNGVLECYAFDYERGDSYLACLDTPELFEPRFVGHPDFM